MQPARFNTVPGGVPGIERLRRADRLLQGERAASATALLAAASEVWAAMFDLPLWPTELRSRAVELQSTLFRYGPIGMTIEQMVDPEREQLRRELLAFLELAHRIEAERGNGEVTRRV